MKDDIKFEPLNEESIKKVQNTNAVRELRRLMENKRNQENFKVDDIVILKSLKTGAIAKSGSVIRRWIISYIDEYNIVYARRILASGKVSNRVSCITTDYLSNEVYDYDPEHVDSILLSAENTYDPLDDAKKITRLKNKVRNINKKKKAAPSLINELKVGDKLWRASTLLGDKIEELVVCGIRSIEGVDFDSIVLVERLDSRTTSGSRITKDSIGGFFKEKPVTVKELL